MGKFYHKIFKSENNKQLMNNISGAILIKGFSLIVNLLTMPAYMLYFRDQQILGIWFTLLSILSWVLMFDLGIGNGLRNNLVGVFVEDDHYKAKQYISSAYVILGVSSFVVVILGMIILRFFDWNAILNVDKVTISSSTLNSAVTLVFVGIMIQFYLKLVLSILNAMQKTAIANFTTLVSSILMLLYVVAFNANSDEKNLINLSNMYILTTNLPLIVTSIILFSGKLRHVMPSMKYYVPKYASELLKLGGQFFWVQVTFMVITSTNEIIISRIFGPEKVVEYQVYYKIFYTMVTLFSLITGPVWSAVTKAYSENRIDWIMRVYKILNLTATLASIACFTLIFFLQPVIDMWLGKSSIKVNFTTAFIFAIFCSIMMYVLSISSIANGIGELRPQVIGNTIAALLKFPLSYLISLFYNDWVTVILINAIIMLPNAIWQPLILRKKMKQLS